MLIKIKVKPRKGGGKRDEDERTQGRRRRLRKDEFDYCLKLFHTSPWKSVRLSTHVAASVCVCVCVCVFSINVFLGASPRPQWGLKKLFETQWLQITDKENYTVRILSAPKSSQCASSWVCVCVCEMVEDRGFFLPGHMSARMCALCVCFYPSSSEETPRTVCLRLIRYSLPRRDGKETEGARRRRRKEEEQERRRESQRHSGMTDWKEE